MHPEKASLSRFFVRSRTLVKVSGSFRSATQGIVTLFCRTPCAYPARQSCSNDVNATNSRLIAHLVGPSSVANQDQHRAKPKRQTPKCRRSNFKRAIKILGLIIPTIMTSLSLIFITLVFYGAFRPVHGLCAVVIFPIAQQPNKHHLITFHYFHPYLPAWWQSCLIMMEPTKMQSPSSPYARMPAGV